jgi:CBS domain containing-hemolysin-like protein
MIDTVLRLLAAVALVAANGAFVAAEFALVTVDRARVQQRNDQGSARAASVSRLLARLSYHLSGAQLGITVTSLLLGVLAEPAVAQVIEPGLEQLFGSVPPGLSVGLALLIATVVQMVFGELVPKAIATSRPLETSLLLARPVALYGLLARPVVVLLDGMAARLTRRLGVEPADELETTPDREELEHLIRSSGEEGTLDQGDVDLMTRSIRLGDKSADDAMVPRVQVVAVDSTTTVDELAGLASETGHSRFPVIGSDLDDIVGVVHVKAIHGVAVELRTTTSAEALMTSVLAVPESRQLDDLLLDLRKGGTQMAVVIDEHGGTAGIITLEDILEEIVGEIDDEYDTASPRLTSVAGSGSWVLSGSLHPDEVLHATGFEMPDGAYETLAGLMLDQLGYIPKPGARVLVDGWRLEVVAMERLRIASIRVRTPVVRAEPSNTEVSS